MYRRKKKAKRKAVATMLASPMRTERSPRLVVIDQAISYSKLSRTKIFELIKPPARVRSIKPGRERLIDLDSLDKYLASELQAC